MCAGGVQHGAGTSDPARLLGGRPLGAPPRFVPGQVSQLVRWPLRLHWQDTGEPFHMAMPLKVPSGISNCPSCMICLLGGAMQCFKSMLNLSMKLLKVSAWVMLRHFRGMRCSL